MSSSCKTYSTKITLKSLKSTNAKSNAIIEAVANSIDANSKNIYINFQKEKVDIFETYFLRINDDGCGFPSNDEEFGMVLSEFMVSNKTKARYGKKGKGRYAFALATNAPFDDGVVIYTKRNNKITKISFKTDMNGNIEFNCGESSENFENNIVTSVIIKELNAKHFGFNNIKSDDINEFLTIIKSDIITYFADIIASNSVNIYVNNEKLIINDYLVNKANENIKLGEQEFNVDYYIWNEEVKLIGDRQKHMLFFDGSGSLVAKQPSGVEKVDFIDYKQCHTVIVKSQYLSEIQDENFDEQTLMANDILIKLCKKITLKLKELLRQEYLKTYNISVTDYMERMNVREKLDDITDEVYSALLIPFVEKFYGKKIGDDLKTIVARLIKVMINTSFDKYLDNLKYILELNDEQIKKFDYVNKNIEIIKLVNKYEQYVLRLDFLNQFEKIVYGEERQNIKERTMLHKIVEKNLWIINEDYEMVSKENINSDESIKRIIKTNDFFSSDNIQLNEIVSNKNISLDNIPDIFITFKKDKEIHIIELKRPTVNINRDILREVEDKYTIVFKKLFQEYGEEVSIKAIAISSELKDMTKDKTISDKGYIIQPNTWRNLINDARNTLNQKLEKLDKQIKHSKWNEIKEYLRDYEAGL